jgi:hypothetical protein
MCACVCVCVCACMCLYGLVSEWCDFAFQQVYEKEGMKV